MKAILVATASALAIAPALTVGASAAQTSAGSWSFSDYTPDPTSLAADAALHSATGTAITSYCHGSRVPSAPQDVTSHTVSVAKTSVLRLSIAATGAWGLDVASRHGKALAGTTGSALRVRLRPGAYVVRACNLGGAPTAQVSYRVG